MHPASEARLGRLVREAVARLHLDLSGAIVFTEGGTASYAVTPVLAAAAGAARVHTVIRASRYGSLEDVRHDVMRLAEELQVADRIHFLTDKESSALAESDIVTNSGHVRPLDALTIRALKADAVIPLMYEAWELRSEDIDLAACRARGIAVAGTNEQHTDVDVFSYLGIMAMAQLLQAEIPVYRSRIRLMCDNPFRPHIESTLQGAGAVLTETPPWDAVLVATTPCETPALSAADVKRLDRGTVVALFWGTVEGLDEAQAVPWPLPRPGHMGILPAAIGPEPTVRLQSGGLKVGEVMWRARRDGADARAAEAAAVRSGYATAVE